MLKEITSLIVVAFLWGSTNPLIKKGTSSDSLKKEKRSSSLKDLLYEWKYLLTNINFIVPFSLNQLGSVLYFFSLQNVDVSIAVPVTNSMTFIFTAITGIILGEKRPGKKTYLGLVLILLGTFIICYDRYRKESKSNEVN